MTAPVVHTIDSPTATRDAIVLSASAVRVIRIPAAVYGQVYGLRLYVDASGSGPKAWYSIAPDGGAPPTDAIPTSRYPLDGHAHIPVESAAHSPAGPAGDVHISVWSESGTPSLYVVPVPVR